MKPFKTILHPTDFSQHSQRALAVAGALARDADARLIVLHVVPRLKAVAGDEPAPRRIEWREEDLTNYREEMYVALQELPLPGLRTHPERLLKEGEVTATVLKTARDAACDLIVMGKHGRAGEARLLPGSVAEAVAAQAHCPVLTVKLPPAEVPPVEEPVEEDVGVIL